MTQSLARRVCALSRSLARWLSRSLALSLLDSLLLLLLLLRNARFHPLLAHGGQYALCPSPPARWSQTECVVPPQLTQGIRPYAPWLSARLQRFEPVYSAPESEQEEQVPGGPEPEPPLSITLTWPEWLPAPPTDVDSADVYRALLLVLACTVFWFLWHPAVPQVRVEMDMPEGMEDPKSGLVAVQGGKAQLEMKHGACACVLAQPCLPAVSHHCCACLHACLVLLQRCLWRRATRRSSC